MQYTDNNEAMLGDVISIDGKYRGIVVACMDRREYSYGPREQWEYLKKGIMVDTDFGGLIHYRQHDEEDLVLIDRAAA